MPLESATFVNDLVTSNPAGASDPKSQGDDHLRLIKSVLKNSFPNMTAAGVFDLVAALNALLKSTGNGAVPAPNLKLQALNPALTDAQYAGSVIWEFLSDLGNSRTGAQIVARVDDVSNATEDVSLIFRTIVAGVVTDRIVLNATGATLDGNPLSQFPAGTRTVFQQTAAPTGWTKDTTHNDKAMRLVSGTATTGGTVVFTTAFSSKSVAGSNANTVPAGTISSTVLTEANLAAHTHVQQGNFQSGNVSADHTHTQQGTFGSGGRSAAHTHAISAATGSFGGTGFTALGTLSDGNSGNDDAISATESVDHSHNTTISGQTGGISANHFHNTTIGGNTGSAGSGTGHTHTFSGTTHTHTFTGTPIDLAVQYVDFIIATKN